VRFLTTFLAALIGLAMVVRADDATTQPAPSDEMPAKRHKIPTPFGLLTDLTDDQKFQIIKIHKDELAQEKLLKAQEYDNIMALLTDDQKKELEEAIGEQELQRKADSGEGRAKQDADKPNQTSQDLGDSAVPATQPSGSN
jgi:Spy/CpxP family protein refolding chaperone